jgi:replicative DNA helicase
MDCLPPSYREKLKDPRWKKRRAEILERDGNACTECDSKKPSLEVHHKYYMPSIEPWDYPDEALQTLCGSCHETKRKHGLDPSRTIPNSLSAEASVLSCMMIDPACIPDVLEAVSEQDFYYREHRIIYMAICHLYGSQSESLDRLMVCTELERRGRLAEVGGRDYVTRIIETLPSAANVSYYVSIVREYSLRRQYILAGQEVAEVAFDTAMDVERIADEAERKLFAIAERRYAADEVTALADAVREVYAEAENSTGATPSGIITGFLELDSMVSGLRGGDMVIIAARPSMGKTALALNITEAVALVSRTPVAVFSMEMDAKSVAERMLLSCAHVDSGLFRQGRLGAQDYQRLVDAAALLQGAQIYIDDFAAHTPFTVRSKARMMQRKHNVGLIVLDYLQLMQMGRRTENRQQEITEISRNVKSLARELGVPIIALSQLNRASESRDGHRPRLSDLRESGSLEQDSDVVLLLHREDYYHRGEEDYEQDNVAEVIVAKHRKGPTGVVRLGFHEKYATFVNLAEPTATTQF